MPSQRRATQQSHPSTTSTRYHNLRTPPQLPFSMNVHTSTLELSRTALKYSKSIQTSPNFFLFFSFSFLRIYKIMVFLYVVFTAFFLVWLLHMGGSTLGPGWARAYPQIYIYIYIYILIIIRYKILKK